MLIFTPSEKLVDVIIGSVVWCLCALTLAQLLVSICQETRGTCQRRVVVWAACWGRRWASWEGWPCQQAHKTVGSACGACGCLRCSGKPAQNVS